MSSHCEHCDKDGWCGMCGGEFDHYTKDLSVGWMNGRCPYCAGAKAEGERIAVEAEKQAARVRAERAYAYTDDREVRATAYEHMADIARGDA